MIKLNRATEYGLMALRHMSLKNLQRNSGAEHRSDLTSAREISKTYGLPFEITAKTLQKLKDKGLIQSAQGSNGGYRLSRALHEINLAEFLELMEGPQSLVHCTADLTAGDCEYISKCDIRHLMSHINTKVMMFLSSISLGEFAMSSCKSTALADSVLDPARDCDDGEKSLTKEVEMYSLGETS